jgi:hypothetical protein
MEAFFIIVLIVCVVILFVRSSIDRGEIKRIKATLQALDKKDIAAPITPEMKNIPSYTAPPAVNSPEMLKPNKQPQIPVPQEKPQGLEKKIGQRLFGILAAVMIFGGLIYLAVQYYEYITDSMKIIFMFAASGAVTLFGFMRSRRDKNSFTLAVTACGEGMFVVSILLSKFYFHLYNDYAVFASLALWFITCLLLAKSLKTNTLNFISILDIFIAICFVIGLAKITDIMSVVILQIVIQTLVLVLSYVMCRKSFAFGLLCAGAVSLITVLNLMNRVWEPLVDNPYLYQIDLDNLFITGLLIELPVVIICSALLVFAMEKLYKDNEIKRAVTSVIGTIIYGFTFLAVILQIVEILTSERYDDFSDTLFIIPVAAIAFGFAAIYALENFRKKGKLHSFIASAFGITSAVLIIIMNLLYLDFMPVNIPLFIPTALAFIAIYVYGKKPTYAVFSCIIAVITALDCMISRFVLLADWRSKYNEITGYLPLALLLFAAVFCIPILQYRLLDEVQKKKFLTPLRVIFLLLSEITLVFLFLGADINEFDAISFSAIFLPLMALAAWYFFTKDNSKLAGFLTFNEYIVLTFSTLFLALTNMMSGELGFKFFIFLSVSALAAYRGKRLLEHKMKTVGAVFFVLRWYGILSAALLAVEVENAIIYSLLIMAAGTLFIVGGYKFNLKSLRIMGLITALICTLKLALIDVPVSNSSLRVGAMVIGGVMCFGISAVYAYFDKRFTVVNKKQEEQESDETFSG